MPNKRAKNRTVIALWMDDELVHALDQARELLNMDRSTFIRYAISAEFKLKGIKHDPKQVFAPDRTGTPRPGSGRTRRAKRD